jgi:hypothetical protein
LRKASGVLVEVAAKEGEVAREEEVEVVFLMHVFRFVIRF